MSSVEVDDFLETFGGPKQPKIGRTADYYFYDNTIKLTYDIDNHVYYLVTPTGTLEPQEGCSSVSHIIDKSDALVPWACKMMEQSIYKLTEADRNMFDYPRLTWGELDDIVRRSKTAHKDHLEDAGNVGHAAHDWIEHYIKSQLRHAWRETLGIEPVYDALPFPEDERAANAVVAALGWMTAHKVEWLETERKVYSRRYKYAGTMDGLCYVSSCNDPECCPEAFENRLSVADWKTSNYLYPDYILQITSYLQAYKEETGKDVTDCWLIRLGKTDAKFEPWHLTHKMIDTGFKAFLEALQLGRSIAILKDAIAELKASKRQAKRAAKLVNKQAQQAVECKSSKTYKGSRIPQCNEGRGCKSCWDKYIQRHPDYDYDYDRDVTTLAKL
jgi:hypothetical protein